MIDVIKTAAKVMAEGEQKQYSNGVTCWELRDGDNRFKVLTQNKYKDSRFAKLAQNGHDVKWLINVYTDEWHLIVDGQPLSKDRVTKEGVICS